jgi:ribosomal protein L37AE/L43A
MSIKLDGAPAAQSGQGDSDRNANSTGASGSQRGRLGIRRRRRDASAGVTSIYSCPACGLRIRDSIAARLGFCDRCNDFTGMCGAGRRVLCPDVMTRTTWHTPCTDLGAVIWEVDQGDGFARTVLCRVHDNQVRGGTMPWIVDAAPVDQPGGWRPQRSAAARRPRR